MSATTDIIGLSEGAGVLKKKVMELEVLTRTYFNDAQEYDELIRYKMGKLTGVQITVFGKREGSNTSTQKTLGTKTSQEAEEILDIAIKQQRERCEKLFEQITKLKEDL